MRFAVIGVGGAGGYFGARLAAAGHDVALIARGAHLDAIRRAGLRVESPNGDLVITPTIATDDPREVGIVDHVLLGVKAWQVPEAARTLAPLIGPLTGVIPLQNGVEAADQVAAALGPDHPVGATTRIISFLVGPGHIKHVGVEPTLEIGELDGTRSARIEALCKVLAGADGITATISPDVRAAMWTKFLFITAWSGVGAAVRAPVGVLREIPETRRLVEAGMHEIYAVGRALGIQILDGAPARAMAYLDTMPAQGTTSMQRDIAEGRPSELDSLSGAATRLGAQAGVATPTNTFLYQVLVPHERRARGLFAGWAR